MTDLNAKGVVRVYDELTDDDFQQLVAEWAAERDKRNDSKPMIWLTIKEWDRKEDAKL